LALISCSECNAQVSDKAAHCIKCGAPIGSSAGDYRGSGTHLTTTQETSKRLKLHIIGSVLLIIIGLFMEIAAVNSSTPDETVMGAFLMMAGLFWFIATRLRIWWHHK
jgi:uncharacterized membrane protein YvbJ